MQKLNEIISTIDKKPVSKYVALGGVYEKDGLYYNITRVYGGQYKYADIEIKIPLVQISEDIRYSKSNEAAISSYMLREFSVCIHMSNSEMAQNESNVQKGSFMVYRFGSRVLPCSAVKMDNESLILTVTVKLPFNTSAFEGGKASVMNTQQIKDALSKRKNGIISAKALKLLLIKNLPKLAETFINQFNFTDYADAVCLYREQSKIRMYLKNNGYICFIGNGSLLPRKGKTDYRDTKNIIPFQSPKSMEITIPLPDGKSVSGMGIPGGVTIITGDAYHGKSTILDAIREGVYNHIRGDGREYVISDSTAMIIQAEDGRNICKTDISFFLRKLPVADIDTHSFTTGNASGSTSQAAAVSEAIESGCKLMLFDEDRSANNFMYKDEKMRSVIKDPSTCPYIDIAQKLYDDQKISTVLVVGASGEYFRIADHILLVERFVTSEYKAYNKWIKAVEKCSVRKRAVDFTKLRAICLSRDIEICNETTIRIGVQNFDASEILTSPTRGQLDFICSFIYYLTVMEKREANTLYGTVDSLYRKIGLQGVELIHQVALQGSSAVIEYVRPEDIMQILYRLKYIHFRI